MSQRFTQDQTRPFEMAIRLAPIGILLLGSDGSILGASEVATELLGCFEEDRSPGIITRQSVFELFPPHLLESLSATPIRKLVNVSGRPRTFEMSIQSDANGTPSVLYFCDVETQQNRERRLEKEASTDELSGLANRRAFQRLMERHQAGSLSLAIIDIDHFKQINDLRGHLAGDDSIRLVGQILEECFGDTAIVISRMGGDEFSVLCETSSSEPLDEALERFREVLAKARLTDYPEVSVTVSVGTVISTKPDISSRTLLTAADRQLYLAKNSGRNRQCKVLLDPSH